MEVKSDLDYCPNNMSSILYLYSLGVGWDTGVGYTSGVPYCREHVP